MSSFDKEKEKLIDTLRDEVSHLQDQIRALAVKRQSIADELEIMVSLRTRELEETIEEFKNSTSWRVTAPLRALSRLRLGRKDNFKRTDASAQPTKTIPPVSKATVSDQQPELAFEVIGHANGFYSLAAVNRSLVLALQTNSKHTVAFQPYEAGPSKFQDADVPGGALIAQAASTSIEGIRNKVAIVQHYPLYVPSKQYDLVALYLFWEESRIPPDMVRMINRHFGLFLAPTRFVAKAALDSGVAIPVRIVGAPEDFTSFREINARRNRGSRTGVKFLHVSSCFPRKGVDVLVRAFRKAFSINDPVELLIKGTSNPHNEVRKFLAEPPSAGGRIDYSETHLGRTALLKLYEDFDVMVLPTRGEGLNLPAAEAIAAGMRVIVTAQGGQADFITKSSASLVDFSYEYANSHFGRLDSVWFQPDENALIKCLQIRRQQFSPTKRLVINGTRSPSSLIQQSSLPRSNEL